MYSFMHLCWLHNLARADNPHISEFYLIQYNQHYYSAVHFCHFGKIFTNLFVIQLISSPAIRSVYSCTTKLTVGFSSVNKR